MRRVLAALAMKLRFAVFVILLAAAVAQSALAQT
jgi:hypothetical protein